MELRRQLLHMGLGALLILMVWSLELEHVILAVLVAVLAGLAVLNRKLRGSKVPVADELLMIFGREHEPPAYGAFWYALGVLLILSFVNNTNWTIASIFMLGISDGISTVVGLRGTHKLPYNNKKTVEGTGAFLVSSLVCSLWIGTLAIPFSILGAVLESADIELDDNLVLSLFSVGFFFLVG